MRSSLLRPYRSILKKQYRASLVVLALLFAGCATRPPLTVTPGVSMETLRSDVSVAASGAGGSGSARGYLVFKRPDRLHVAILSPFGTSLLELFSQGERIVCLIPSKMTAYTGTTADLASRGLLAQWGLLQWVLAPPPARTGTGTTELVTANGRTEKVSFYENGLVERKGAEGVEVVYKDYRDVDGVPFPERVEISGPEGQHVHVVFDEPEVNRSIEEDLLVPKLEGYQVLPLAAFPAKL